jgi:hypothetical protein
MWTLKTAAELNMAEKHGAMLWLALEQQLIRRNEAFSGGQGLMWCMNQQLEAESVPETLEEHPTLTRTTAQEEFLAFNRRESF